MRKNIKLLYLISIFYHLIPAYAIERLFALERGQSVQMMVLAGMVYSIATIALEVPSGILSDRLGRRKTIVLGMVFCTLEFVALLFAGGFWFFALSMFMAAVGNAALSGTQNALLYETLQGLGKTERFEHVSARIRVVGRAAGLLAGLCGGVLGQALGFHFNYLLSTLSMGICIPLALLLRETLPPGLPADTPASGARGRPAIGQIMKNGFTFFRTHSDILHFAFSAGLLAGCAETADEFWQVYLDGAGLPLALVGVVAALFSLADAPGALLVGPLLKRFSHKSVLGLAAALLCIGLGIAALASGPWGIAGIALALFAGALLDPVRDGYIHRRADPSARATIESVGIMVEKLLGIGLGLAFGYVCGARSIFAGYGVLCVSAAVGAAGILLLRSRAETAGRST